MEKRAKAEWERFVTSDTSQWAREEWERVAAPGSTKRARKAGEAWDRVATPESAHFYASTNPKLKQFLPLTLFLAPYVALLVDRRDPFWNNNWPVVYVPAFVAAFLLGRLMPGKRIVFDANGSEVATFRWHYRPFVRVHRLTSPSLGDQVLRASPKYTTWHGQVVYEDPERGKVFMTARRHLNRSANMTLTTQAGRQMRFPVEGDKRKQAVLCGIDCRTAEPEFAMRMSKLNMQGSRRSVFEFVLSPDVPLTRETIWVPLLSIAWMNGFFTGGGGG